jgi:prepilin signal peptidase PulO-like enzyme (type II secretory pathway)
MEIFYGFLVTYIGMLLVSFGFVLSERIPTRQTLLGHSYCESCKKPLNLVDVLPLIGYIKNRGKCLSCGYKIPIKYPLFELFGGLSFLMIYLIYGFSYEFFSVSIFLIVMLIETMSDVKRKIVIDRIWMIGLVPLIIISILNQSFLIHLTSALIMFVLLYLIALTGKLILKKDALGGGDIKLYLFVGFFLTWQQALLSLFFASLIGFIYGKIFIRNDHQYIPLVPFIMIGAFIAYFWGDGLINWYINLLRM